MESDQNFMGKLRDYIVYCLSWLEICGFEPEHSLYIMTVFKQWTNLR